MLPQVLAYYPNPDYDPDLAQDIAVDSCDVTGFHGWFLRSTSAEHQFATPINLQRFGLSMLHMTLGKPPANSQKMFPLFAVTVVCRRLRDQHRCRNQQFYCHRRHPHQQPHHHHPHHLHHRKRLAQDISCHGATTPVTGANERPEQSIHCGSVHLHRPIRSLCLKLKEPARFRLTLWAAFDQKKCLQSVPNFDI